MGKLLEEFETHWNTLSPEEKKAELDILTKMLQYDEDKTYCMDEQLVLKHSSDLQRIIADISKHTLNGGEYTFRTPCGDITFNIPREKYARVPFEWELGKKVFSGKVKGRFVTDGENWPVRILCFDREPTLYPIVGLVGNTVLTAYSVKGESQKGLEARPHKLLIELERNI